MGRSSRIKVILHSKAGAHEIDAKTKKKLESRKLARDTKGRCIEVVQFNCSTGNYRIDLLEAFLGIMTSYNPFVSDFDLVNVMLTLDSGQELANYIDCFDIYYIGVRVASMVLEFGKLVHDGKVKVFAQGERLKSSYMLPFDEGYGGTYGMGNPSDQEFGRENLIDAVRKICDTVLDKQSMGRLHKICYSWKNHMTNIAVTICEAGRFDPVGWFIDILFSKKKKEKLPPWMVKMLNEWSKMSKVLMEIEPAETSPIISTNVQYAEMDVESFDKLCKDRLWIQRVLILGCRYIAEE